MSLLIALTLAVFGAVHSIGEQQTQSQPQTAPGGAALALCEMYPRLEICNDFARSMDKRKSAYMRFGRSPDHANVAGSSSDDETSTMEKRKSAYMRFGKRAESVPAFGDAQQQVEAVGEPEKRKSAYMRFGKRKSAYMRFGKRSDDEVEETEENGREKRKSAYMRFGKRSAQEVAANVQTDFAPEALEVNKRKSAYMRFGR